MHTSLVTLISSSLTSPHLPSQQIITAVSINLFNPKITTCTASFEDQNYAFLPQCIYMFCVYLRTNRKFCPTQQSVVGLYYRDGVCCVVRTGSLGRTDYVSPFKVLRDVRNMINFLATRLHVNAACLSAQIYEACPGSKDTSRVGRQEIFLCLLRQHCR